MLSGGYFQSREYRARLIQRFHTMATKNPLIDLYLQEGCGRCPLGGTPECKVHDWQKELKLLRAIVLDCGLTEELKWKIPCYTSDGRNVVMIRAMKDHASINFFKGSATRRPTTSYGKTR